MDIGALDPCSFLPPSSTGSLTQRAKACLADVSCSAGEASRLFIAADDARERDASCYRFLDANGTPRDARRARACLERERASLPVNGCHGDSAGDVEAELAVMRIDGIGGTQDIAGGRALVEDCFDDVTREGILAYAMRRETEPRGAHVRFCEGVGGTTLIQTDCSLRQCDLAQTRMLLETKRIAANLDDEGKSRLTAATAAYDRYVESQGWLTQEAYAGGSLAPSFALGRKRAVLDGRTRELTRFAAFIARDVTERETVGADRAVERALASVHTSTDNERATLATSQDAWRSYREAEVSLYVHVYGARDAEDRVRRTIALRLAKRRLGECAPPLP
jgi:hypothetical protein